MTERFRVVPAAYAVLIRQGDDGPEVLLQLRQNTGYMDGHWATGAAGHVEQGESVLQTACREAAEELGIQVDPDDLTLLTSMHRTHGDGLAVNERVDWFVQVARWQGEPAAQETHKVAGLGWFPLADLPEPMVPHERFVYEALRAGRLAPLTVFGFAGEYAAARP